MFPSKTAALDHYRARDRADPERIESARGADARRARRRVPRPARGDPVGAHDPGVARTDRPPARSLRRRPAARAGRDERRPRRLPRDAAAAVRARRDGALRQRAPQVSAGGSWPRNPAVAPARTRSRRRRRCASTRVAELDAIAAELGPAYRPLAAFGAATGLRPEEWSRSNAATSTAPGGCSASNGRSSTADRAGGKTKSSVREVPLTWPRPRRARHAPPGSTRRCCSRRRRAGRSTSTTSAGALDTRGRGGRGRAHPRRL